MASLPSFTQFCSLPRWHWNLSLSSSINLVQLPDVRLRGRFVVTATPRKKVAEKTSDGEEDDSETKTTRKRAPSRRKKKAVPEENLVLESSISNTDEETSMASESTEVPEKPQRRTRKKEIALASTSSSLDEEPEKKVTRRRRSKKTIDDTIDEGSETELSEREDDTDSEKELEFDAFGGEDISNTYLWPPLVCCFGSVKPAFVPSGRRANRLINHEANERMEEALWIPEKFVRAPGSCVGNVAVCLARLGNNAALMSKIGNDDCGQAMLYHLNDSKVQTRSVRIDAKRMTAMSRMKMSKRGGLRMTCINPCAEDMLTKSEINIDVLKEAKMFYFNAFSLIEKKMRASALQAIKISKQLGGAIFFDLNLPLPLWNSREETQSIIQEAWELADVIEVTKQELEFLCGIVPSERFDTKDNHPSKFVHYGLDVVAPILHDNLKVLFVTNGTSMIHYYTKEHNRMVLGTEDIPITAFTSDMSAAGDGIVAGLLSKLVAQPHLMTDKEYLVHIIEYAINCGVKEQWAQSRKLGHPPKAGVDDEDILFDPNGYRSISEEAFRTYYPPPSDDFDGDEDEDEEVVINDSEEEDEGDKMDEYDSEDEPMPKLTQPIAA
ncbi:fructokinase-like 2, chloroplastic [Cynara cardunculus var. scolymus]|uniref:fructokinase-like 2, chloroplastic n=1 Tax=Cynara cardunculus var. scolymus TaxID=59895 RepID=UPI000D6289BE|nr:fructokinase-like 2, chloroplastic [Cynara cardunculus var. scolymus]